MIKTYELSIDNNLIQQHKQTINYVSSSYISTPNKTKEESVREIFERYNSEFKIAISTPDIKIKESEIQKLINDEQNCSEKIQQSESKITELQKQYDIKTKEYLSLFPNNISLSYKQLLSDLDLALREFSDATSWFKKTFGNKFYEQKNIIKQKFNELELIELEIKKQQNIKKSNEAKIIDLNKNLNNKQNSLDNKIQQIHDKISLQMHEELAVCEYAFENREKYLQRYVPKIHGIDSPNEPVAIIQSFAPNTKYEKIEELLKYAGLPIGDTPESYTILETKDYFGNTIYSIMTPFFSPNSAREQIHGLLSYFANYGIKFLGVTKPFRQYQIDPLANMPNEYKKPEPSVIESLLAEKINDRNTKIYRPDSFSGRPIPSEFYTKYKDCLFRGQTFMTSDPRSSYATITDRAGAFGAAYAGIDAHYASCYAGYATNLQDVAGKTMPRDRIPTLNFHGKKCNIGVLSVYKKSDSNIMFKNLGLESAITDNPCEHYNITGQNHETQLDADLNPLIARYFVLGDRLILIDEDDPKWNIILNYFAPRLSALYNNENGKNLCTLLSRIKKQREQYRQNNNKTITHDMTPEQMKKMGIELKSEQFKEATTRIKSINIKQSPTNIVDDTKQSI